MGRLAEIRQMAEELAGFLGVEYYEDKLYRSLGAFTPQCGPGTNPTRTYPTTGEVVELDINEREEFGIEDEFLHEFHERYEDGLSEREEHEAAGLPRR